MTAALNPAAPPDEENLVAGSRPPFLDGEVERERDARGRGVPEPVQRHHAAVERISQERRDAFDHRSRNLVRNHERDVFERPVELHEHVGDQRRDPGHGELLQLRAPALEEHPLGRGAVAGAAAEHRRELPVATVRLERAAQQTPLRSGARLEDARRAGITQRERRQTNRQVVGAADVPLDRRREALAGRDDDARRPAGLDEGLRDVETVEEAVARVLHVHHRGAVAAERDLDHVGRRRLGDVVRGRSEDQEIDVARLDARGRHRALRRPARRGRRSTSPSGA